MQKITRKIQKGTEGTFYVLYLKDCPHCHANHQLTFDLLATPQLFDDGETFTHVAICPKTGNQIFASYGREIVGHNKDDV